MPLILKLMRGCTVKLLVHFVCANHFLKVDHLRPVQRSKPDNTTIRMKVVYGDLYLSFSVYNCVFFFFESFIFHFLDILMRAVVQ